MKVAISGASGFIGSHLTGYLQSRGFDIVPLGREDFADGAGERLVARIAECDAVVNLAGAPIDHRWTRRYKKQLYDSRIETTRRLVDAVDLSPRVKTFVSTSAVGFYPAFGCWDEFGGEHGTGFLAGLCAAWEAEARKVRTRCVVTRFGVVLSDEGGAFPKLSRSAKAGVAVVAGSGEQSFSWIALDDLLRAEEFLLTHPELDGVFNLTAPETPDMRSFMHSVTDHYRSRLTVRVPAFAVRLVLGQAAAFVLDGQCAVPRRLLDAGFRFGTPTVDDFLKHL